MPDHKRPRRRRDPRNVFFETQPGLWVEWAPYTAELTIDGVEVHIDLDWDRERNEAFIARVEVWRGAGRIEPAVLRQITIPRVIAERKETGAAVYLWADEAGTEPYDESRRDGETLEAWAARLFYVAAARWIPPVEYIAKAQGIKVSSAYQRIVIIKKMGLIGAGEKEKV